MRTLQISWYLHTSKLNPEFHSTNFEISILAISNLKAIEYLPSESEIKANIRYVPVRRHQNSNFHRLPRNTLSTSSYRYFHLLIQVSKYILKILNRYVLIRYLIEITTSLKQLFKTKENVTIETEVGR